MILLVDNYDSFSYNLYQLVGQIDSDIKVIRNDELSVAEINELNPDKVIISPGPGRPEDAGIIVELVQKLDDNIPLLGVCLGHQAICAAFGAEITYAKQLMHGKQSTIEVDSDCKIFSRLDNPIDVARYHSLAADESTLPESLRVTAQTADGEVMAVEHVSRPVYGLQFHPESILTPKGKVMLENFLNIT